MTRRMLLTGVVAASAAAAANSKALEVGMHQATLWKCDSTIREDFEAIARAGFKHVELRQSKIDEQSQYSLADVKSLLADNGLAPLGSQHAASLGFPDAEQPERFETFKRKIEQTAELGLKLTNCACVVRQPRITMDHFKQAAENYRRAAEFAADYDIVIVIEFMKFSTFLSTLPSALWMTRAVGHPNLNITVDAFHVWAGRSKLQDFDDVGEGEVFNFHINDAAGDKPRELLGDPDRVMPGDGELPLAEMLRRLAARGYRGKVVVELFSPQWWGRPVDEVCRVAKGKVDAVMAQL
jgi:sugar phosphate isomerase/epimerase